MKKLNYRFAIFDVEGTLLDNKRVHRKMVRILSRISNRFDFLRRHNGLLYLATSGTLFSYSYRRLQPLLKDEERFASAMSRLDRLIFDLFDTVDDKRPGLFPGAKEVLESLHRNGVKLFATTGADTKRTEERLEKAGISSPFTLVIGGDVCSKIEHIPHFAERLDIGLEEFASQSFYLGDTLYDMCLSKFYGAHGIGITNTVDEKTLIGAGAEKVISRLEELLFESPSNY